MNQQEPSANHISLALRRLELRVRDLYITFNLEYADKHYGLKKSAWTERLTSASRIRVHSMTAKAL